MAFFIILIFLISINSYAFFGTRNHYKKRLNKRIWLGFIGVSFAWEVTTAIIVFFTFEKVFKSQRKNHWTFEKKNIWLLKTVCLNFAKIVKTFKTLIKGIFFSINNFKNEKITSSQVKRYFVEDSSYVSKEQCYTP